MRVVEDGRYIQSPVDDSLFIIIRISNLAKSKLPVPIPGKPGWHVTPLRGTVKVNNATGGSQNCHSGPWQDKNSRVIGETQSGVQKTTLSPIAIPPGRFRLCCSLMSTHVRLRSFVVLVRSKNVPNARSRHQSAIFIILGCRTYKEKNTTPTVITCKPGQDMSHQQLLHCQDHRTDA